MTRQPEDANALAASKPMPEFPPVTMAHFPFKNDCGLPLEKCVMTSFAVLLFPRLPAVEELPPMAGNDC